MSAARGHLRLGRRVSHTHFPLHSRYPFPISSDGRLPQPALDFITDFFLAKFSLRSVANMYSKGLIRTLERSADEHPRLRTMRLLCGLDLGDDLTHLATKRERMMAWVLASSRGTHRLASFLVQSCTSMPGAAPAEGSGEEGAEVGVAAVMGGSAPADDAAAVGMVPLARAVDLLKTMYPVDGGPVLYRACSVSSELQERIIAELRSAIDNGPDAPPARSVHVDVVVAQAAKAFGLAIAEGRVRAQALFHEFDDDGNGLMDFDEFKTFLNRTMTGREVEERCVQAKQVVTLGAPAAMRAHATPSLSLQRRDQTVQEPGQPVRGLCSCGRGHGGGYDQRGGVCPVVRDARHAGSCEGTVSMCHGPSSSAVLSVDPVQGKRWPSPHSCPLVPSCARLWRQDAATQ